MSTELYKRYRPTKLDDVVGQAAAVKSLRGFKTTPHTILFHGPSGTGKTTLARIVAEMVGCSIDRQFDYIEVNCGVVESAMEMVREIQAGMRGAALTAGGSRVWVLDEVQSLSRARFAQEALLKILEDTPAHVYFFLCTTDPGKILKTIRNRATEIALKPVPAKDLAALLKRVAKAEKDPIDDDLAERLAEAAAGSPRRALVELERVLSFPADERADQVGAKGAEKGAFDLAKALLYAGTPQWAEVAAVLKAVEDEDAEGLRQMLLACARTSLLKAKAGTPIAVRCFTLIDCLKTPFYDASGRALLASACYEVCTTK